MSRILWCYLLILIGLATCSSCFGQTAKLRIAKLKYDGGGDWYANPSSLKNLLNYVAKQSNILIHVEEDVVEPSSTGLQQYPLLYITGHGNIIFSEADLRSLKTYLLGGGFLLIDDNYGLFNYAKRELKKLFPEQELKELPFNHPLYKAHTVFANGLPKIHEHDGLPAQGFGLFGPDNRLIVFVTYQCDLGDGWEDPEVHRNPEETRKKALDMGLNILNYVFLN
jgi:hypothetical protein